jgi:hypothetical protein
MKLRHLPTLCAALLALCPILASAQTSAVPGFISYQGRVVDASGANVGAGTPVNRTVIFRIWDNPSSTNAANLIYSEAQTVTVSEGEFSVLVGQGVANTTQSYGYSETAKKLADIGLAFGGSTRFLGVTVAAASTIATTDNEITPRQQIVSTAFAMRAKYAEQVGSNGIAALTALDSGRVGIGTLAPPALFTVSGANVSTTTTTPQLLVTADDLTERLRIGVDSTNNGTGFLQAFKEGTGAQNLLLNPNGGNVGIGNTNPAVALSVTGAITATGAITGGSISTSGAITATGAITGGSFTSAAGSLTTNTGNIGIGTTAPTTRFQLDDGLNTGPYASALISRPTNSHTGSHMAFMRTGAQVMGVGYAPSVNTFGFGQGVSGVAFSPGYLAIDQNNGNVGIGTASPGHKLDVAGTARVTGQMNVQSHIMMTNNHAIYGTSVAGEIQPAFWPRAENGTYLNYGTSGLFIRNNASALEMYLNGGRLGVGTTDTSQGAITTTTTGFTSTGTSLQNGATSYAKMSYRADRGGIAFDVYNSNQFQNVWRGFSYDGNNDIDWYSDRNLKKDIVDAEPMLDRLMQVPFRRYRWKDISDPAIKPEFGVIAQEVEPLFPDLVATGSDGMKTVGYTSFATITAKALQEYKARNDADLKKLNAQIHEKDAEIQALRDETAALRHKLAATAASQEERLLALERRMSGESAAKAVSLKTVSAAE